MFVTLVLDDADQRLDRWLKTRCESLGYAKIQKLIRTGQIRVNGKRVTPSMRLEVGQIVRLPPSMTDKDAAENTSREDRNPQAHNPTWVRFLKACTLYEDDAILVLNKPAGLAVQGGSGITQNLDQMLKSYDNAANQYAPLRLVHRLDRETSGVLVVAKTIQAARHLTEAFRTREVFKTYDAITQGIPHPAQGTVTLPLRRIGVRTCVDHADGDEAVTRYRVLETFEKDSADYAHVTLEPLTGRTHQIRAHLAALETPIVGDFLYGNSPNTKRASQSRLYLHATRIILPCLWRDKARLDVTAPLPERFEKFCASQR